MLGGLKEAKRIADEHDVDVSITIYFSSNLIDVLVSLKDMPIFTMHETYELDDTRSLSNLIHKLCLSLKNKYKEDIKNFSDEFIEKEISNYKEKVTLADIHMDISEDIENMTTDMFNSIYIDSEVNPDFYLSVPVEHIKIKDNSWIIKTESNLCNTCKGSGMVDYGFYGAAECPDCKEQWDKEQKPLSAWDKKLKEELENGDDTWGSISRKFKK
jgi:hypothetical protein